MWAGYVAVNPEDQWVWKRIFQFRFFNISPYIIARIWTGGI